MDWIGSGGKIEIGGNKLAKWTRKIPTDKGNNYYWVYDSEYDIFWFCQKTIDNKFVWFHADGISDVTPWNGIGDFQEHLSDFWWYKIKDPKLPKG